MATTPRKRRVAIAGAALGAALTITLAMALVPVPQHVTLDGAAIYDLQTTCPGIYVTPGTAVTFHWSTPSTNYFFVVSCSANQLVYEGNGTSGSGTFVSTGGVYEFGASCPEGPCVAADVSVNYTSPLLVVTNGDWTLVPLVALVSGWAVVGSLTLWLLRRPPRADRTG